MKKRLLVLTLALCMALCLLPMVARAAEVVDSGSCGDNLTYTLTDDGTLTISGTGQLNFDYRNSHPWYEQWEQIVTVNIEEGVTMLGRNAFAGHTNITSIHIPDSVTGIGVSAFDGCTGLTDITIPNSVVMIGENAFSDCSGLTSITIPDSVVLIADGAFENCTGLTDIVIGSGVKSLGSGKLSGQVGVFEGCTGLTSITLPDTLTDIGCYTFASCIGLTNVTIPDSITEISTGAFENCIGLTKITIPDSVTSIGRAAFEGCAGLTAITIPDSVTEIRASAFYCCGNLKDVKLSRNLQLIKEEAFTSCGLTELVLPGSITAIEKDAFARCEDLTKVTVSDGATAVGGFTACTALKEINIPESVTTIGDSAFDNCTSLMDITIPDSVITIGNSAFNNCSGISGELTLPKGLTHLGSGAFSSCDITGEVVIPGSVENVAAFSNTAITSVVIEPGVKSIGNDCFYECDELVKVSIPDTVTSIGEMAFQLCTALPEIDIPASVSEIGEQAFFDCYSLTEITIPEGVTRIDEATFFGCTALKKITLPSTLISIFRSAFSGCESLTELALPSTLRSIDQGAFTNCAALTELVLPEGLESIGYFAFDGCTGLTELYIPASVTSLHMWTKDKGPFTGSGITTLKGEEGSYAQTWAAEHGYAFVVVEAPEPEPTDPVPTDPEPIQPEPIQPAPIQPENPYGSTVASGRMGNSSIGSDILWTLYDDGTLLLNGVGDMPPCTMEAGSPWWDYRNQIKKAVIGEGITNIGELAFYQCENLESVTIPQGVTEIGNKAFYWCRKLQEVVLPDSVTYVGREAFWLCEGMTRLELGSGVEKIDYMAFASCRSLTELTIPASVKTIGNRAFEDCGKLASVTFHGDAPEMLSGAFSSDATLWGKLPCYYPAGNATWTQEVFGLDNKLEWIALCDNHSLSGWTQSAAPTCTAAGEECRSCAYCDYRETRSLEALGHSYAVGKCTRCGEKDPDWVEPEKPVEPKGEISRLAGGHRYETAFLAANQMKINLGIEKFDAVVVASGTNFADALSGSYLAAVKNAPILLACNVEWVNDLVKDYIKNNLNPGGTVYILGGTGAVPENFKNGLDGFTINRLAGDNRFLTNLLVLEEAGVGDKPILVCTGLGFADSLSASASKLPILLVYGDKLTADQAAFMESNQGRPLYIIGGDGAVSAKLETALTAYGEVKRLAGGNRFETSVLIAETFFENPKSAVLAYAWDFPDGLCGGPLATTMNAPLILTMEKYETQAAAYVQSNAITNATILGGEKLIPESSVNKIFS